MRRCLVARNAFVKLSRCSYLTKSPEISYNCLVRPNVRRGLSGATRAPADALSERLQDIQTGDFMNELALENSSSLTTTHLLAALNSLIEPIKNNPNYTPVEEARLQHLCTHLLKKIRFFELREVITILSGLVLLKVPADTVVMQSYLQVLRSHVNDLDFRQIFWLGIILKKASSTPLVEALKLALPVVLHNHLDIQMDLSDAKMMAKLFSYAAHHHFLRQTLTKISIPLMKLSKQWTCDDAMAVLWGAVFLNSPFPDFGNLILTATDVVVQHVSEIPHDALLHFMSRLEKANLLSEPLLKAVSKKALLEKWEMKSIHDLLWLMSQVSYLDISLLESYAKSLESRFSSQDATLSLNLQEVVAVFARLNFVSHNMGFLLKEFVKLKDKINDIQASPDLLVRFVLDLIILGASPSDVVSLLHGSKKCIYGYSKKADQLFIKNILLLKTIMGTSFKNEKLDILVEEKHKELCNIASDRAQAKGFPLKFALEKVQEHLPYKLSNGIITKSGIYFDHLLVNVKDSSSTSTTEVRSSKKLHIAEELLTSETLVKIAILANSDENYAVNTNHHNGETQLTILALKKEGFLTVQICLQQWNELLHQEQIPYLMHAVKTSE